MSLVLNRRGVTSCLLICFLVATSLVGVFYFVLRNPEKESIPKKKPVITSFKQDISGRWQAKLLKTHAPPGRKKNWSAPWMDGRFSDFDAVVEIGKDFHLKHLEWVEVRSRNKKISIDWNGPENWKWSEIEHTSNKDGGESRCNVARNSRSYKVFYFGTQFHEVRECGFEIDDLHDLSARHILDGGFRESGTEEIEAEAAMVSPEISSKEIPVARFRLELTPHGMGDLTVKNALLANIRIKDIKLPAGIYVKSAKNSNLDSLVLPAYPGTLKLSLVNCDFEYWPGNEKGLGAKARLGLEPARSKVKISAQSSTNKAKVVFSAATGEGRLFTHNGAMEYKLSR